MNLKLLHAFSTYPEVLPKYHIRVGDYYRLIAFTGWNTYYSVVGKLQVRSRKHAGKLELSVKEDLTNV